MSPVISVPLSNTPHDDSLPSMPCADGPTYTLKHPPSMPMGVERSPGSSSQLESWLVRPRGYPLAGGKRPAGRVEAGARSGLGVAISRASRHNAHKASLGTAQALSHRQAGTLTALKPIRR